jgi:DNA-binding transcriptional MerR regulator
LARQLGVTTRTIRFYEDKHLISPQRAGTTRVYTHRDRARLMLILRGKRLGFSLREIKEFLDLYDVDPEHHTQLRQLLNSVVKRMDKLQAQRAAIDESLTELTEIERQCEAVLLSRKR